jgi:phospholipase C
LTNTSFELSGPKLPYDSYTGDMVHRLFHMWQQSDCDVANATKTDPAGCKNDLYPFVGTARDDSGGNALGFYNVQKGQASLFKRLADHFTISDNYHQADMGGTGVNHTMLGTARQPLLGTVRQSSGSAVERAGRRSDAQERNQRRVRE